MPTNLHFFHFFRLFAQITDFLQNLSKAVKTSRQGFMAL